MQRSKGFFLTLPSNSSSATFPLNTVVNFTVQLPETLSLEGDWEVALAECYILIPGAPYERVFNKLLSTIQGQVPLTLDLLAGSGHYDSVPDLVKVLDDKMLADVYF